MNCYIQCTCQGCAQDDLSGGYLLAKVAKSALMQHFMLRWWCKTSLIEWWLKVAEWWLGLATTTDQCGHIPACIALKYKILFTEVACDST